MTALEWLEKRFYFTNGQLIDIDFEKAKEMEKNNLYDCASFWKGDKLEKKYFELYYNEFHRKRNTDN